MLYVTADIRETTLVTYSNLRFVQQSVAEQQKNDEHNVFLQMMTVIELPNARQNKLIRAAAVSFFS